MRVRVCQESGNPKRSSDAIGNELDIFRFDKENVMMTLGTLCAIVKNVKFNYTESIDSRDAQNFAHTSPKKLLSFF